MCLWTFYGGFVGIMSRFKRGVSVIKSLFAEHFTLQT